MYFIPIVTTLLAFLFFGVIIKYYFNRSNNNYLLWLAIGLAAYGAGTFAESYHSIAGFSPFIFKLWYISGALLGGWSLTTGIMYLILNKKTADVMMWAGLTLAFTISFFTILSPVESLPDNFRLTGSIFHWKFIRSMTAVFHIYTFVLLMGAALYAAFQYSKSTKFRTRFLGIIIITAGGLLPGIGSSHSNMEVTYSFYVTELIGLILIFYGCIVLQNNRASSILPYNKTLQL